IANGNVGALLQQLPGVSAVYNDSEARSVMIRGIDAGLNTVSMDGSQLASPNSTGLGRAFEFEQTSLGSIERIEITKAPTADQAVTRRRSSITRPPRRARPTSSISRFRGPAARPRPAWRSEANSITS